MGWGDGNHKSQWMSAGNAGQPSCNNVGVIIDFFCILDLESGETSQRAQSSYLGTIKRLNGLSMMIMMMMILRVNLYLLC